MSGGFQSVCTEIKSSHNAPTCAETAIVLCDVNGAICEMNSAAERLTGWLGGDAFSKHVNEVITLECVTDRQVLALTLNKSGCLSLPVDAFRTTAVRHVSGRANRTRVNASPILDDQASIVGTVLTLEPHEEDLERELILKQFADAMPLLAWMADGDGWVTWYNQRWYEYTGMSSTQMEGWGWQSVHEPEMLPSVMERWSACIRLNEPFEMIFPLRGADGEFRSFLTRAVPVCDASGRALRWFGTNVEVDELLQTKRLLEESEACLNQVLTVTGEAVLSLSKEGVITYLNPQADLMFGCLGCSRGDRFLEVLAGKVADITALLGALDNAKLTGQIADFELTLQFPHASLLECRLAPIQEGFVLFCKDGTERRRASEALLQSEKLAAVGRLAATVSHEINNPLEAVTNLVYLARTQDLPPFVDEYLRLAEEELRRVSIIATQTLQFFKQQSKRVPVHCADFISRTLSGHRSRLINKNIRVRSRLRASDRVRCLDGEILQVIGNLVSNAIDALPALGGELFLRTRNGTDWRNGRAGVYLTVADNGSGIPELIRSKIFDAFFSTKGICGNGLGLWISQEILDRHEASIRFRTATLDPHRGTTISVFLPLCLTSEGAPAVNRP